MVDKLYKKGIVQKIFEKSFHAEFVQYLILYPWYVFGANARSIMSVHFYNIFLTFQAGSSFSQYDIKKKLT